MNKLVFVFKNGFELEVDYEKANIKKNNITGELTEVTLEGCREIDPVFFRLEDVMMIYRKAVHTYVPEDEKEENQLDEQGSAENPDCCEDRPDVQLE